MKLSPYAGKLPQQNQLVDIPKLLAAYYSGIPDPAIPAQRISFGTSGHRGSSFDNSFNENHILAISQAICLYRKKERINGPLFIGIDTHALSIPAYTSALEVFAGNKVAVIIADENEYTPTPVISWSILTYNQGRKDGLADGVVITPSHNPPSQGGYKYNPPNGGPAGTEVTKWIEAKANELLEKKLADVKRIFFEKALKVSTTTHRDLRQPYINDLKNVIDMESISASQLLIGIDPLGGAGVHYWEPIAAHYKLNMKVVSTVVDPTFSFMTVDWDGQIRMDPSSPYAMQRLIGMKDRFEISAACDTDHDRHGIVTKSVGLMPPNHYLSAAISYLMEHRPQWNKNLAVGKTVVTSAMIEKVTEAAGRKLNDVPVGFKWFVDGLINSSLCFGCEESAGATFLKKDGSVWTTDKDGIVPALLAAEIKAVTGKDPGELYNALTKKFGESFYDRVEAHANTEQKTKLQHISAKEIKADELAGEKIKQIITKAPGNNADIGGIKAITENGWFAARPSGTEDIYKIYAESFKSNEHLKKLLEEAQKLVDETIA